MNRVILLAVLLASVIPGARAQEPAGLGAELERFSYPFPVQRFPFSAQRQPLSMAYMDVAPARPDGRTIVLLHGKNFCGATWEGAIGPLRDAGYRVVVPDQIGFCKSTKPAAYQFGFHELAANTAGLLAHLGVQRATIVGHSMGGMLATRYALSYPDRVDGLVMVNPIGLEDWQAEGVSPETVEEAYRGQLKTTAASIERYQRNVYYGGEWRPAYDRWVDMLAGMYAGYGRDAVVWNQALTDVMVFAQPVVHEFPRLTVPTLLLIGERDRTALGRDRAPPSVADRLGDYPRLARRAADRIPNAELVTFADLGHAPQVEDPARFNAALIDGLRRQSRP